MRSFVAEPFELEVMQQAFDTFCARNNILSRLDRESVALQITGRFSEGARTVDELTDGLSTRISVAPSTQDKLHLVSVRKDASLKTAELIQLQNSGLITLTLSGWALTVAGRAAMAPTEPVAGAIEATAAKAGWRSIMRWR